MGKGGCNIPIAHAALRDYLRRLGFEGEMRAGEVVYRLPDGIVAKLGTRPDTSPSTFRAVARALGMNCHRLLAEIRK